MAVAGRVDMDGNINHIGCPESLCDGIGTEASFGKGNISDLRN